MFELHIIQITYTKAAEYIDRLRTAHRTFLDEGYAKKLFIASGPSHDASGGYIIAKGDLSQIKALLEKDPFALERVASYTFSSFNAVKYTAEFANCCR